jgi:hypothetical protein
MLGIAHCVFPECETQVWVVREAKQIAPQVLKACLVVRLHRNNPTEAGEKQRDSITEAKSHHRALMWKDGGRWRSSVEETGITDKSGSIGFLGGRIVSPGSSRVKYVEVLGLRGAARSTVIYITWPCDQQAVLFALFPTGRSVGPVAYRQYCGPVAYRQAVLNVAVLLWGPESSIGHRARWDESKTICERQEGGIAKGDCYDKRDSPSFKTRRIGAVMTSHG